MERMKKDYTHGTSSKYKTITLDDSSSEHKKLATNIELELVRILKDGNFGLQSVLCVRLLLMPS